MSKQENKDSISIEERMNRLEDLIAKMEDADITLDESFELYKQGISEVKLAGEELEAMEKAMLILTEDGETEEFE